MALKAFSDVHFFLEEFSRISLVHLHDFAYHSVPLSALELFFTTNPLGDDSERISSS